MVKLNITLRRKKRRLSSAFGILSLLAGLKFSFGTGRNTNAAGSSDGYVEWEEYKRRIAMQELAIAYKRALLSSLRAVERNRKLARFSRAQCKTALSKPTAPAI